MKIGIHLSTFTKSWEEDIFQYFSVASKIGYDGVEIPIIDANNFDSKKSKKLLKENNLLCTCGTGLNIEKDISSIDKNIRDNGMKHLKKCIDICNELESDCLGGVLYAPWGMKKSRAEAKDNINFSIESLREIASYAEVRGVTLALEVLNRYETFFINTVEEGLDILKKIDSNNVKIHFDTFHGHIEEKSLKDAILKGGKNIFHVHFCENNRSTPGTGQINWREVKKALKEINYDRWITLENFTMPNCQVGNDVSIWRKTGESNYKVAELGFKFIKQLMDKQEV
ncbi:sugar phosphate isomerase/epimerase family protein [Clostridium oceanicum]|uniref:TIM barrel protein n=1 Tax=Clostridium oceanicum TaxID=1543 RepID=A0ABP3UXK0_9CLOT